MTTVPRYNVFDGSVLGKKVKKKNCRSNIHKNGQKIKLRFFIQNIIPSSLTLVEALSITQPKIKKKVDPYFVHGNSRSIDEKL